MYNQTISNVLLTTQYNTSALCVRRAIYWAGKWHDICSFIIIFCSMYTLYSSILAFYIVGPFPFQIPNIRKDLKKTARVYCVNVEVHVLAKADWVRFLVVVPVVYQTLTMRSQGFKWTRDNMPLARMHYTRAQRLRLGEEGNWFELSHKPWLVSHTLLGV